MAVFSWVCLALGGVIPNSLAIFVGLKWSLKAAFGIPALFGLLIFIVALMMERKIEMNNPAIANLTTSRRAAHQIRAIKRAFNLVPLRRLLIFYAIYVLLTPSLKDYLDYFYNFAILVDSSLDIVVFCCIFAVTLIYSVYLEDKELQSLVRFAILCYIVNQGFNMLLVSGLTFGLTTFQFVSMQTLFFDSWYQAFLYLPAFVII